MARFDKSSTQGTKPNAAVAAPRKRSKKPAPSYEDTMFFPRLRRHAKWLFVFLALAFGLGFVGFGVGAGGVGVGDLFRSNGGGETASVSDAREKTEENPKDVEAWRELSTALQTEGETEEALGALQIAVSLDKKDADLYRELAGLYLAQASAKSQEVQRAQIAAAYGAPGQNFPGQLSFKGKQVFDDPIGQAINAQAAQTITEAQAAAQSAAAGAVEAYKSIVKLRPDDPNVQSELALAAQQTGDLATAIAAYKRFLVLAPDDANAPIIKQQLKQLQQAAASSSG